MPFCASVVQQYDIEIDILGVMALCFYLAGLILYALM